MEGVTPAMAVALGEHEIKTLEDLAGCATDDLIGYYETNKDKERVRVPGALEGFNLTSRRRQRHHHEGARQGRLDRRAVEEAGRRSAEGEETERSLMREVAHEMEEAERRACSGARERR